VQLIHRPKDIKDFRRIFGSTEVIPSKAYLEQCKIYYEQVEINGLEGHFSLIGKKSINFNKAEFHPRSLAWQDVAQRLKRERQGKKNADVRLSFRFDHNMFLVKRYFTFGLRWVMPGTRHVVQTTNVPLLFFALKYEHVEKASVVREKLSKINRTFIPEDRMKFRQFILMPNQQYVIASNTQYIIVTTQQTLFSVDVVDKSTPLPFECLSPLTTKEWIFKPKYAMTPCVDRMTDAELMPPPPSDVFHAMISIQPVEIEPTFVEPTFVETIVPDLVLPTETVVTENFAIETFTEPAETSSEPADVAETTAETSTAEPAEIETAETFTAAPPAKRMRLDFVSVYQELTKKEYPDPKMDWENTTQDETVKPLDLSLKYLEFDDWLNDDMENAQSFEELFNTLKCLIE